MTITEIEKAIEELSLRHDDLTKESLLTLLLSAGWERRTIDEALLVYETMRTLPKGESPQVSKSTPPVVPDTEVPISLSTAERQDDPSTTTEEKPSLPLVSVVATEKEDFVPQVLVPQKETTTASLVDQPEVPSLEQSGNEAITFLLPDGTEEKLSTPQAETVGPVVREEAKKSNTSQQEEWSFFRDTEKVTPPQNLPQQEAQTPHSLVQTKDVSLVEEKSSSQATTQPEAVTNIPQAKKSPLYGGEIPNNLPVVPFEISHDTIWTFDKYKDAFHKEGEQTQSVSFEQTAVPTDMLARTKEAVITTMPTIPAENANHSHRVVEFEETPITKTDESLVVLASVMLLAIILILGYMYGQGRL